MGTPENRRTTSAHSITRAYDSGSDAQITLQILVHRIQGAANLVITLNNGKLNALAN